jgi:glycosyltransferase involved in cell wall biosynthesis
VHGAIDAGEKRGLVRILAFGTYQAADHPRIAVLCDGLRQNGHVVAEANVPLGLSTKDRVDLLGRPSGALRMAARLLSSWGGLARKALAARRGGGPDAVLVGYMGHFDVWLARLLFPRTPIVLDHLIFASTTAQDRGVGGGGAKQTLLRWIDRAALTIADVVLLDTEEHRELVPARLRPKSVVVPVGASDEWFAAGDRAATTRAVGDQADRPVRVIFYGLFTPLQGAVTIARAISLLPADGSVTVTMIGSGQDHAAAVMASTGGAPVDWLPWVDSTELPDVVAAHDVGIGIVGTTDKAMRVVPNKVYQCAAAGTAVITSDTAPQRRAFGDAVDLVAAGDPDVLAGAIRRLASDRALLASRRSAAAAAAEDFRAVRSVGPLDERLRALSASTPRRRS